MLKIIDCPEDLETVYGADEYGYLTITFVCQAFIGEQELDRMKDCGIHTDSITRSCLRSRAYNTKHWLSEGKTCTVVVVPGAEFLKRPTMGMLRAFGKKRGYGKPLASHILRIRELVTADQMKEWGFAYIASPHNVIRTDEGVQYVLGIVPVCDNMHVETFWVHPCNEWGTQGAFVFPIEK